MSQTEVQLIKSSSVVDGDIVGMSSSKLSGTLPAVSGANLTNLPAANLSSLSPDKAYRALGSQILAWYVIPLTMCICTLVVGVVLSPLLRHGLDRGLEEFHIADLYAPNIREMHSHRITIHGGKLDLSESYQTVDKSDVTGRFDFVIPLYIDEETATNVNVYPQVLLNFRGVGTPSIDEWKARDSWTGIHRNLFWEGPSQKVIQHFRDIGRPLSHHVIFIEMDQTGEDDLMIFIVVLLFMFSISILTGLYLKFQ